MSKVRFDYIGKGAFIPGVPARDLSADEIELYNEEILLNSGLYRKRKAKNAADGGEASPDHRPGSD